MLGLGGGEDLQTARDQRQRQCASRKQGAGSREQGAGSREQGAGVRRSQVVSAEDQFACAVRGLHLHSIFLRYLLHCMPSTYDTTYHHHTTIAVSGYYTLLPSTITYILITVLLLPVYLLSQFYLRATWQHIQAVDFVYSLIYSTLLYLLGTLFAYLQHIPHLTYPTFTPLGKPTDRNAQSSV
ncbi:hypothetical protein GGR53DRAFT_239125 [Hypoxylon sp. FL1150]|nr:hypothetical protein GGR53DRAFT_239125 [Hypoxylon sp. FL1150]